jgi:hypothetical protein
MNCTFRSGACHSIQRVTSSISSGATGSMFGISFFISALEISGSVQGFDQPANWLSSGD